MSPRERAARAICARLRGAGHRALLAGGCVRDHLLGVEPRDYDIATSARGEEVVRLFDRTIPVGIAYGVVKVLLPEGTFEVTTFRRDGPYLDGRRPAHVEFVSEECDAQRRDFTINALFLDTENDAIIDFVQGQKDLKCRTVRAVGEPKRRFEEDHLRLLRAVRFAARLDYEIEPATLEAMRELAPFIQKTSAERIRDELVKMLTEGGARRAFELMDTTGLLDQVLPEVSAMHGVAQPEEFHPEGDVFEHTMLLLEHLDTPSDTLAFGALLHDVGKPPAQSFEDRIRFNHHDKVGARMAGRICRRLRMSNADTERITWLVGQHMRLSALTEMRESRRKRFVREPGFHELLELGRLDCLASHRNMGKVEWIENYLSGLGEKELRPKPLLRGHDLIRMGFVPGALFSEILKAVEDAQLDGALHSKEDAIAYVLGRWRPGEQP